MGKNHLHQRLGILPRHKYMVIDQKRKPHKLLLTGQVLQRDMGGSVFQQLLIALILHFRHLPHALCQKHRTADLCHIRKEKPCIHGRVRNFMLKQKSFRIFYGLRVRHIWHLLSFLTKL